jgi:DNA invertase Pin-like site-specific DNA recombinase
MGKMVFTVIGAVAELERDLIRERVAMGLKRAKKQGKRPGQAYWHQSQCTPNSEVAIEAGV